MTLIRQLNYAVVLSCLLLACKAHKKKNIINDSARYDLLNPVIIKLPEGLAEISGIVYFPKDTSVFAIEDGLLYKINVNKPENIKKWRFDKKCMSSKQSEIVICIRFCAYSSILEKE